jgi:hypothetical protein
MITLGHVYLLISVVLFAIATVVHFNSVSLSLPISPVISVLAAVLPIAGFLNAYVYPSLLYASHSDSCHQSGVLARFRKMSPFILQTLQALVAAVLATLLLEGAVPSQVMRCVIENRWLAMFRAHDAGSIRHIQDRFDCCGFNSVRDRGYPFPGSAPSTCPETYGRNVACRPAWTTAMQMTTGMDFGVVVAAELLQLFGLWMMTEGTNWWTAWRSTKWIQPVRQSESSQPLLTGPDQHGDEETGQQRGQQSGPRPYGATEDDGARPRVEPSALSQEHNEWRDN